MSNGRLIWLVKKLFTTEEDWNNTVEINLVYKQFPMDLELYIINWQINKKLFTYYILQSEEVIEMPDHNNESD